MHILEAALKVRNTSAGIAMVDEFRLKGDYPDTKTARIDTARAYDLPEDASFTDIGEQAFLCGDVQIVDGQIELT